MKIRANCCIALLQYEQETQKCPVCIFKQNLFFVFFFLFWQRMLQLFIVIIEWCGICDGYSVWKRFIDSLIHWNAVTNHTQIKCHSIYRRKRKWWKQINVTFIFWFIILVSCVTDDNNTNKSIYSLWRRTRWIKNNLVMLMQFIAKSAYNLQFA